jgi:oxygen-dependent protoporphyrinogen oxidase
MSLGSAMASHFPTLPVAVIGGGITGLTAAWHLQRAGIPVVVFEASAVAGGAIGSTRHEGWLHEAGPNTLLESSVDVAGFVDALGLGSRRLYAADAAKNRYVVRDGKLVAMPASPLDFLRTPLFSWRAKMKLMKEPFRARSAADQEESVAQFVERRLGREFLDYAVNPFVGGVYAGDPQRLSLRHAFPKLHALEQEHGSLLRGAIKRRNATGGPKGRIFSFPEGLIELPRALAHALGASLWLSSSVQRVCQKDEFWEVVSKTRGETRTGKFSAVLCALPADALAALHFQGIPGAARLTGMHRIEHPPVVSIFTGFRREDVTHPLDGFGLLMPEVEHRRILGTLFSSTLFPGRAPESCVALTTFVGGVRSPLLAQLDDAELDRLLREELGELLGVHGAPVFFSVRRWPRAIPQYELGYAGFKDIFTAIEAGSPGLHFGGNARDGISLANCIASGQRLAKAVTPAP